MMPISLDYKIASKVSTFLGSRLPCLWIKDVCKVPNLPATPLRGLDKMYNVKFPALDLEIDLTIASIVKLLGGRTANFQYNIDAHDHDLWSPPLNFHFDRGAHFTILAGLRGLPNKHTIILPLNELLSKIGKPEIVKSLTSAIFLENKHQVQSGNRPFAILKTPFEDFSFSSELFDMGLELSDIHSFDESGTEALNLFKETLNEANQNLLSENASLRISSLKKYNSLSFCILSGDILILNNLLAFHGRTSGTITNTKENRWLRTVFISH